jgi:glycosyltransferase involved in cell wall biosynthesis
MRIALVAPHSARCSTALERRVEALARCLADAGAEVGLIQDDPSVRSPQVSENDGVLTRRFPATSRGFGFATAPELWDYIRHEEPWDVVHMHAPRGPLSVATGGRASPRLIFTPHSPIQRLIRWPHAPVVRAVLDRAACVVPLSRVESQLIRGLFPHLAERVHTMPVVVDIAAIDAARPLEHHGRVIIAGGRLERRVERVIASMAGLDGRFRLVILGAGARARRLARYADDLRVSERVEFVGAVSNSVFYSWLRTARVFVTLCDCEPCGSELLEALSAGASAVASDVEVHREAAAITGDGGVRLVDTECSPLDLADAIAEAAEVDVPSAARSRIVSAQAVADTSMLALYRSLLAPGVPR